MSVGATVYMHTLLIVDDNEEFRRTLVQEVVRRYPACVRVIESADCHSAQQLLRRETPDTLSLDLNLPDGNGLDLAREMRGMGLECRIIVMSCADDPEYQAAARALGIDAFLSKAQTSPRAWLQTIADFLPPVPPATTRPAAGSSPINTAKPMG